MGLEGDVVMKTRNYLTETDPYYDSKTLKQWKLERRCIVLIDGNCNVNIEI